MTITRATGIELAPEVAGDGVKAYKWLNELQRMISSLPDGVTVSGYFERIGEESLDMERFYVIGREVVSAKPTITWPDPTVA